VDDAVVSLGRVVEDAFKGTRDVVDDNVDVPEVWRRDKLLEDFVRGGDREEPAMAEFGRSVGGLAMFFRAARMASRTEALDCARLVVEARRVPEGGAREAALGLWESLSRAAFALSSSESMMTVALSGQVLAKAQ